MKKKKQKKKKKKKRTVWHVGVCSVMKETSWCLFLKKSNLKLLKLSARQLDIWTIY